MVTRFISTFQQRFIVSCVKDMSSEQNTGCPTRYRTRHFFNNSNTNKDIVTIFEQEYVRCVRNEEQLSVVCVSTAPNILVSCKMIKEVSVSVASGTSCIMLVQIFTLQNRRLSPLEFLKYSIIITIIISSIQHLG
jgi:hypothetical protein